MAFLAALPELLGAGAAAGAEGAAGAGAVGAEGAAGGAASGGMMSRVGNFAKGAFNARGIKKGSDTATNAVSNSGSTGPDPAGSLDPWSQAFG